MPLCTLTPLIVVTGLRYFCSGLLIQPSRTGIVTVLTVVQLSTTVAVLLVGLRRRWSPVRLPRSLVRS